MLVYLWIESPRTKNGEYDMGRKIVASYQMK